MYELISLLISLGSSAGSGAQDTTLAKIKAEGITDRARVEGGATVAIAGFETVGTGYRINNALAKEVASRAVTQAAIARKKDEQERQFKRTLTYILVGGAALLIIFVVFKK